VDDQKTDVTYLHNALNQ